MGKRFVTFFAAVAFVVVSVMGSFGFNFMFTDAFGIDVAYRYQMFVGDHGRNISDVIASVRVNF